MSKRIIAIITVIGITALSFAACGNDTAETSAEETTVETVVETTAEASETAAETEAPVETEAPAETSAENADGIPQPGDTYNGHTVDHTEDQPNCDDGSHGTIWVFYTDSEEIDFIEY